MKVLHLISSSGVYGAEKVIISLVKELIQADIKTYVGIFYNVQSPHLELQEALSKFQIPVKIFYCRGKFDLKTIFDIRKFVDHNSINIIHSHGYKSNFYALCVKSNCKKIATCHNWLRNNKKMRFYKCLDKFLLRKFDKIAVVSKLLKDEIIKSGVSKENVILVNNGVDVDSFYPLHHKNRLKDLWNLKEDEKVIGSIGRLTLEKGHIYLLKAFKIVKNNFPNVKLLIVGDGLLGESLKLEVNNLGLSDHVVFAGFRNDIPEILNIIDIFVLPSLTEGMPMALLEAMAAKRTIVVSRVGEIPQIIKNGLNGVFIEPGDVKSISESILLLLKDKEKANFVANNAYQKAKNELSSRHMAKGYEKIYSSVLK